MSVEKHMIRDHAIRPRRAMLRSGLTDAVRRSTAVAVSVPLFLSLLGLLFSPSPAPLSLSLSLSISISISISLYLSIDYASVIGRFDRDLIND